MMGSEQGPVHLTYCSNIYPGESWPDTLQNIRERATEVKARFRPDARMALGLRLSAKAADELLGEPDGLARLRAELDQLGIYVFTINGFPYGDFHGTPVKSAVYRPDWRARERVKYTLQLAQVLSGICPPGARASISTVPVGFRPEIADERAREVAVCNLLECAAGLWRMREAGGADVALALEPEPACYLETTAEAISFIERDVLSAQALHDFARQTGMDVAKAEQVLRHHVGICLDTCHAAVAFEDPRETVRAIASAGVRLAKVQATAGLHVEPLDAAQLDALRAFADPVYLHQVVARCGGEAGEPRLVRFVDLSDAMAALEAGSLQSECWRVHYHVPIFERELAPFTNTQDFLAEALDEILRGGRCDQIEVETYTWSVLPERYRTQPISEMIAGELGWVERAIGEAGRRVE